MVSRGAKLLRPRGGVTLVGLLLIIATLSLADTPPITAASSTSFLTLATTPSTAVPVFPVNFTEVGLPQGANWSLTVLGHTWTSSNRSLVILEPNGSFDYSANSSAAPWAPVVVGSYLVLGHPVHVEVNWTITHAAVAAPGSGSSTLGGSLLLSIIGLVVVLGVAIAAVLATVSRRERAPPLPPARSTSPLGDPARDPHRLPEQGAAVERDPLRHML